MSVLLRAEKIEELKNKEKRKKEKVRKIRYGKHTTQFGLMYTTISVL